jgi:hypothetical protein
MQVAEIKDLQGMEPFRYTSTLGSRQQAKLQLRKRCRNRNEAGTVVGYKESVALQHL